eukprot:430335-Alexandrium_andersonii.AAC.1
MSASLVGSEMCIRDSVWKQDCWMVGLDDLADFRSGQSKSIHIHQTAEVCDCLLYTSDAADDM